MARGRGNMSSQMYADHSEGWITVQNSFNQSPKSLLFTRNMYFEQDGAMAKRQGTSDVLAADNEGLTKNIDPFVSNDGKDEWIMQSDYKFFRINDDGTTDLLKEIGNNDRCYMSDFAGKKIIGNRNIDPLKYGYVDVPNPPITGTSTSGSLSARTYFVRVAYTTSNGVTKASRTARQDLDSGEVLTVTSPPNVKEADQYKIYASETENEEKLIATKDVGNDYTESDSGDVPGTDAYPENNTAWFFLNLSGGPPTAEIWHTHSSRAFAANTYEERLTLHYSALNNADSWGTEGTSAGNGIIEFDSIVPGAEEIRGLATVQDRLVVFFESAIAVLFFPEDATAFRVEQVMQGKGCISPWGIVEVGNDVFWFSKSGIQALSQNLGTEDVLFDDSNPSARIRNVISRFASHVKEKNMDEYCDATYYPEENWVVFLLPEHGSSDDITETRLFVFDLDFKTWSFFDDIYPRCMAVNRDNEWYGGIQSQVIEIFDDTYDDRGEDIQFQVASPWLFLGQPQTNKKGKFVAFPSVSGGETKVTARYLWDFGTEDFSYPESESDSPGVTYFGEENWEASAWTAPARAMIREPIRGKGTALKLIFEEESDVMFKLPWFRVDFITGGRLSTQ